MPKSKTLKDRIEDAATARCDLNIFYAIIAILEGGTISIDRNSDAQRIIAVLWRKRHKRLDWMFSICSQYGEWPSQMKNSHSQAPGPSAVLPADMRSTMPAGRRARSPLSTLSTGYAHHWNTAGSPRLRLCASRLLSLGCRITGSYRNCVASTAVISKRLGRGLPRGQISTVPIARLLFIMLVFVVSLPDCWAGAMQYDLLRLVLPPREQPDLLGRRDQLGQPLGREAWLRAVFAENIKFHHFKKEFHFVPEAAPPDPKFIVGNMLIRFEHTDPTG